MWSNRSGGVVGLGVLLGFGARKTESEGKAKRQMVFQQQCACVCFFGRGRGGVASLKL